MPTSNFQNLHLALAKFLVSRTAGVEESFYKLTYNFVLRYNFFIQGDKCMILPRRFWKTFLGTLHNSTKVS